MWNVAHRELRAGPAIRLGGDDADREAELDELAGREVAPVALGADAASRGAGQHRADLDLLDAGVLNRRRQLPSTSCSSRGPSSRETDCRSLLLGDAATMRRAAARYLAALTIARASMPSMVPQSISWMITSCATSTRRRVR